MTWTVEFREAYDEWDTGTDVDDDAEIRLAPLDLLLSWKSSGPPPEAEYDELRETWSCDVPGAPVLVEFVAMRYLDPPVVIVRELRGP